MNRVSFTVLAEVYRILSLFDEEAIIEASKHPNISENMRSILHGLASEVQHNESMVESRSIGYYDRDSKRSRDRIASRKNNAHSAMTDRRFASALRSFLTDSRRFSRKNDLEEFTRRLALPIRSTSKESKARFTKRIQKFLLENSAFRESVLQEMLRHRDPQTSGYLGLILGHQK